MVDVESVRQALINPRSSHTLFTSEGFPDGIDLTALASTVEEAWSAYQQGDLDRVVSLLPSMLESSQQWVKSSTNNLTNRRLSAAVSARIYHLAATTLAKFGETTYAWIAAEHAMKAADDADDPLVLASAARAGTHALLSVGRFEDAVELGQTASGWLSSRMAQGDRAALSLYGMLHLRTAMAAAKKQDHATTEELLFQASCAADEVGTDANHWHTGFGPTNVKLHRLAAALELGDIARAAQFTSGLAVDHLPIERQVAYFIDSARTLVMNSKDEQAVQILLTAEEKSATIVRNSTPVRETVRSLQHRAPITGGSRSSLLSAFAERCDVTA